MKRIFNLSGSHDNAKIVVMLPGNICKRTSYKFLQSRIISPGGFKVEDVSFVSIEMPEKGKIKKDAIVEAITSADELCKMFGIKTIVVGVADVYKVLAGTKQFVDAIGTFKENARVKSGSEEILEANLYNVVPFVNPVILNKFPHKVTEVQKGLNVAYSLAYGKPFSVLSGIEEIKKSVLYKSPDKTVEALKSIFNAPEIFMDIETTGLSWYDDRILTISFATNSTEAFCVAVDKQYHNESSEALIKNALKQFFEQYKGTQIWHNMAFDIPFIVHNIMRNRDFSVSPEKIINKFNLGDTMIMAYLLYNSTERPSISLKALSYKWFGEYDKDIDQKNLVSAPVEKVAEYNNIDVMATCKIFEEMHPRIKEENFVDTYNEFIYIGKQLLKMKMNGIRIDMEGVEELHGTMATSIIEEKDRMLSDPYVNKAQVLWAEQKLEKYLEKRKTPCSYTYKDFLEEFNPGSPAQKQLLFFDMMGLPVISRSKTTRNPSADKDSMDEWLQDPNISDAKKDTIRAVLEYQLASKIQSSYIDTAIDGSKLIEEHPKLLDCDFRLFADFKQTATITGRLSSSGVWNLQTIPSGSKYGKAVKKLLIAPKGFVIATADYSALEDVLMANESQDKNKLAIFKDGIDGHCLNAYSYFKDEFEARGLKYDPTDPNSINKIKSEAPDLRQAGKAYTFGFSYGAGPQKYGEDIYNAYWETYSGVKKYNDKIIKEATENGYLISKFSGLRLWLPALSSFDEFILAKEQRVATNFSIQSGNFLMLRALAKTQKWIEENNLTESVKIVNTVHDSIMLYVKEDVELISKVNKALIGFMTEPYDENQILPLSAELDIGNNYAELYTLKNDATAYDINEVLYSIADTEF